jgi:uncharacterized iron-regulated membrane protein
VPRRRPPSGIALWRWRYHRAVRRLLQLAMIALGIRALWRWRNRRRAEATSVPPAAPPADPADELRQKLAASRADDVVNEAAPSTPVEDRRGEVHEQARATLEDMKSADEA